MVYRNLEQFKKKILPLVMKGWSETEGEDSVDKNFTQKICEKMNLDKNTCKDLGTCQKLTGEEGVEILNLRLEMR